MSEHIQRHALAGWQNIGNLWRDKRLCDCLVSIENQTFPCHSVVLASQSKFLRSVLVSSELPINRPSAMGRKEIQLDFLSPKMFEVILDYIYFGEIKMKKDLTIPLLSVCARLEIGGLITHILKGVLFTKSTNKEIEVNSQKVHFSIIGLLEHFREKDENKTVQEVIKFMACHFTRLADQTNLGNLSVQCFVALLEKQEIQASELEIFNTLCKWLEIRGTDSTHAPLLLSKIHLEDLTLTELKDIVEQKQYFTRRNPCQKLILEAYKFKALNKRDSFKNNSGNRMMRSEFSYRRNRMTIDPDHDLAEPEADEMGTKLANMPYMPQPGSGEMLMIGGMNVKENKANRIVYSFKEDQMEWTEFAEFPSSRIGHQACRIDNFIYVIGGCKAEEMDESVPLTPTKNCFRLNLNGNKWETIEDMGCARYQHQCFTADNRIYVIGGLSVEKQLVKIIECYDISKGIWTNEGTLKTSRILFSSCFYNDRLWILGGIKKTKDGPLSLVESWDLKMWKLESPLHTPVMNASAISYKDKMFNIGGRERQHGQFLSSDKITVYSATTRMWEVLTRLALPRHQANLLNCNNRIYILGGQQKINETENDIAMITNECWDIELAKLISPIAPLPFYSRLTSFVSL